MQGKELIFAVKDPPRHWIVEASNKSGKDVFVRGIGAKNNHVTGVSLFKGENDPNVVKNLGQILNITVEHISKNPEGIFAAIEYLPTVLDDIMTQIVLETASRVWAKFLVDKGLEIVVENPWDEDVRGKILAILQTRKLTLKRDPIIRIKEMEVPIPLEPALDDLDRNIAKTLLIRGYYETPRPDGVTQELLCRELHISKPTLEQRMRKIQSIGIKKLLSLREFSEKDLELSWQVLQTKIKPR
jgi:hypothetical protein